MTVTHPAPETWDSFVESQNGHFLQTSCWGELKHTTSNWDYEIVALENNNQIVAGALVLYWRAPFRLGTVAYVPRGPVVDWQDESLVVTLLDALACAASRRAILLKLEPDLEDTPEMRDKLASLDLHASPHRIQARSTILVDIGGSEEEILSRMNQGTRRKIRTAAKRDVTVRHGEIDDVASFHSLMEITSRRDSIAVRSLEYHRRVLELFAPEHATLLLACHQGCDLGGIIAVAYGKHAWYLFGGSSNEERERMPNYAIQWEAIRWARERGCTTYDLFGIPDEDEATLEAEFQQRRDGMWGLYGFKRGFGGRIYRAIGTWDRPCNPLLYRVYRLVAATRDWWRNKMRIQTMH